MVLWNRKKLLKETDEIIDWYKMRDQEYRSDLEQKNKLILQYQEKEAEYLRDKDNKKRQIQELQQQVAKYEQEIGEYLRDLENKTQLIEELQQKVAESEQRGTESKKKLSEIEANLNLKRRSEVVPSQGHYQTMERIAQRLANQQPSSVSPRRAKATFQTMTPPTSKNYFSNQTSSQTVQFNPFKYSQGR